MDVLFRLKRASAAEVHRLLPNPPSYSTVRKMLSLLEGKGQVRHRQEGLRYIYEPALEAGSARRAALRHLLHTFFGGSERDLVTTLSRDMRMSAPERERLAALIRNAQPD
jgi:predicted transcriptional regulator